MSWSKNGNLNNAGPARKEVQENLATHTPGDAVEYSKKDAEVLFDAIDAIAKDAEGQFSASGHRNDNGSGNVSLLITYAAKV